MDKNLRPCRGIYDPPRKNFTREYDIMALIKNETARFKRELESRGSENTAFRVSRLDRSCSQ